MVDVTEDFLVKAKTYLGEEGKRVRNFFCCGLQDFSPEPQSYDVIWIQWVIGEPAAPLCTFLPISAPAGGGPEAPQLLPPRGSTSKAHLFPHFVSTQYLLRPIWGQFFVEKNIEFSSFNCIQRMWK